MNDWPIQFTTDISVISLGLLVICMTLFVMLRRLRQTNNQLIKQVNVLSNEFRAMNSGHLGMGREIRKVIDEIAHVEDLQVSLKDSSSNKSYEQASLLLTRGATIEEVVETCDIAPAEAELLAIMRNSAPAHFSQQQVSV